MSKAKTALLVIVGAAALVYLAWQRQFRDRIEREDQDLRSRMESLQNENEELSARVANLQAVLDRNQTELRTLTERVARLNRQNAELAALRDAKTSTTNGSSLSLTSKGAANPTVSQAEVAAFLQRSPSEQGQLLGSLRGQALAGQINARTDTNAILAGMVREKLEDLEKNPAAFADFQSSFIRSATGLEDETKLSQIRDIIEKTYQQAVADGLDSSRRPPQGAEEWALRRDALDRQATKQVEDLLTPEEKARFSRAFLGVMGIDLGIGDGARHRFTTPGGAVIFPSKNP